MDKDNSKKKIEDTFFLDRDTALTTAKQKNYFTIKGYAVKKLQTCYHPFEMEDNDPDNLISVPFKKIATFFTNEDYRVPTKIDFSNSDFITDFEAQKQIIETIKKLTTFQIKLLSPKLLQKISELQAYKFTNNPERIRISMYACTYTTVMQYSIIGLAEAFERLNCQVQLVTEKDDLTLLKNTSFFAKYSDFKPHITININHQNSAYISDDIFNVIWWQDPMSRLAHNKLDSWRKRDLVYYATKAVDINNNLPVNAQVQGPCIDKNIFKLNNKVFRENKIVFIGSSYNDCKPDDEENFNLYSYQQIKQNFIDGELEKGIDHINNTLHGEDKRKSHYLLNYLIRDFSVKWLCEQNVIPVEVYGRGWNYDPIINKYFKGEVKHGEDIAKIYQSAQYALVCLPHTLNTQRLAEVVACGCIPIVYDCRDWSEGPYWNDHLFYYKTKKDILGWLDKTPVSPPQEIANYFYYDNFAKKILTKVIAEQPNLYYG